MTPSKRWRFPLASNSTLTRVEKISPGLPFDYADAEDFLEGGVEGAVLGGELDDLLGPQGCGEEERGREGEDGCSREGP